MGGQKGPKWKREAVPDHKFDFIDTRDYHSKALGIRLQYLWVYILVIKSFLVYISDIYTATTMLTSKDWSNKIFTACQDPRGCVAIPFAVAKWLFVGCIIFSFLLLAYEARKAKKIIASRDISFAFTNVMAQNYYSLRSYDHFCFFCHINDSTKKKDDFAFFIFFTFKDWKRLLLADGPRQTINALTLYSFIVSKSHEAGQWWFLPKYFSKDDMVTNGLLVSIIFTVTVFLGSLLLLIIAAILYIPLLCYIQGNLKEYCCHKVDKRISELIQRKRKQRVAKVQQLAKKEAAGDFSHRTDKNGVVHNAPQPTLPQISLDDDDTTIVAPKSTKYSGSIRTDSHWSADHKDNQSVLYGGGPDYPPMPAYDPSAYPPQPGYASGYASSHGHDTSHSDYSNNGYRNDQYNYGENGYGQTGYGQHQDTYAYGGYDQQGYGTTPVHQDQSQYQQRAPSRDMLSRNERERDGRQSNGTGGYYTGSHAV